MTIYSASGSVCFFTCSQSIKNEICQNAQDVTYPYHEIFNNYRPEIFLKNNPEITFGNYDFSTPNNSYDLCSGSGQEDVYSCPDKEGCSSIPVTNKTICCTGESACASIPLNTTIATRNVSVRCDATTACQSASIISSAPYFSQNQKSPVPDQSTNYHQ